MKCFHAKQGIILPGIAVQSELHEPVVVFGKRTIPLSFDFIAGFPTDRIRRADLRNTGYRRHCFEPESVETSDQCLLFIETRQSTGAINVAVDGMVGTENVYFKDNKVQATVRLQGRKVVFNSSWIAVSLEKGQEVAVHTTFREEVDKPWPRTISGIIERIRSGPDFNYRSRVMESYRFDGDTVVATAA